MLLLVGLGNPGTEYAGTRHNIGFMAVDAIVRRHGFGPWRRRFQGEIAEGQIGGVKALALKPLTYMNLSGQSVAQAAGFYKLSPADVVVFHDELDLAPLRLRVKRGGGHGGHNGLRSIDAHLGKDYLRVRLGIGHPGDKDRVTAYVLGGFAKAEQPGVTAFADAVADHLGLLLAGQEAEFQNRVHLALHPPAPKAAPKVDQNKPASGPKQSEG